MTNQKQYLIDDNQINKLLDKLESRYTVLVNEKGIQGYQKILERNILSNLLPLLRQYKELRQGEQG